MQHLDEGTLHAWLDGDRSGVSAELRLKIEQHVGECEECAARIRDAEKLARRAGAILSSVEPADSELPPFSEVMRRAGMSVPAPAPHRVIRRWIPVAWAASVAGAIGLGWWTNDLVRVPTVAFQASDVDVSVSGGARAESALPAVEPPVSSDDPPPARPEPAEQVQLSSPAAVAPLVSEEAREETELVSTETILRGLVTNEDGEPLAEAQIFAEGSTIRMLTEDDGTFALSFPPESAGREATAMVTAGQLGYRQLAREVALNGGDTVSAYFPLVEEAQALDEVVATGGVAPAQQRAAGAPELEALALGDVVSERLEQAAADTEGWVLTSLIDAERGAGFSVVTVPGLDVLEVELGTVGGVAAVRVRQSVSQGVVLIMTQQPTAVAPADRADADAEGVETVVRDGVLILGQVPRLSSSAVLSLLNRAR